MLVTVFVIQKVRLKNDHTRDFRKEITREILEKISRPRFWKKIALRILEKKLHSGFFVETFKLRQLTVGF